MLHGSIVEFVIASVGLIWRQQRVLVREEPCVMFLVSVIAFVMSRVIDSAEQFTEARPNETTLTEEMCDCRRNRASIWWC